jgi:hypothetical protein
MVIGSWRGIAFGRLATRSRIRKQNLILFPPELDTISQQQIAHINDISYPFLPEEFVFDKKNMALQPNWYGHFVCVPKGFLFEP